MWEKFVATLEQSVYRTSAGVDLHVVPVKQNLTGAISPPKSIVTKLQPAICFYSEPSL